VPGGELDDALVDLPPASSHTRWRLRSSVASGSSTTACSSRCAGSTPAVREPAGARLHRLFLLSAPVAFLSTTAAALLWTATILLHVPVGRLRARGS
jgi:hypothetical protein